MAFLNTDMSEHFTEEHLDCLHKADIWTINDFFSKELMDIKKETNVKYHILKDLQDRIKQRYTIPSHDLNFIVEKCIRDCKMCPTGLPELTLALDGGFQTQEIVEFSGESETGKTEMCYLLCGEILSHFEDYHILYIASNFDFDHEKVAKYTRLKAGNRCLSEEDLFKALSRVEIAKPSKLTELVHLLNTLVHGDRRNKTRCIVIDSLSFLIQDDILDMRTANLQDADELEKFLALKGLKFVIQKNESIGRNASIENTRKEIIDIYLHEIMRLLTSIALTKNVIVVLTNSDPNLSVRKSWTNGIDHRINLSRMPDHSRYVISNPRATVCRATIVKTIHNISKIGYSIPFAINDEGLFAIRLASGPAPASASHQQQQSSAEDQDSEVASGESSGS